MMRKKYGLLILLVIAVPSTVFASLELLRFFAEPELYLTGAEPLDIVSGDINNDGFQDLLTANRSGRNVSIFLGNGDGTFTEVESLPVNQGATSLALRDLDGDTFTDVVVTYCSHDDSDNGVIIFKGLGDGQFEPAVTYGFTGVPYNVLVANLNDDQVPDIAASDYPGRQIIVLLSKDSLNYSEPIYLPTGLQPIALMAADLNGDGLEDLITSDHGSGSSSVYLRSKSSNFGPRLEVKTGELPYAIALGDLNSDGIIDLIAAHSASPGFVTTHFGHGDGTFELKQKIEMQESPIFVNVHDFDQDKDLDLVTTQYQHREANIFLNLGDGHIEERPHYFPSENEIYALTVDDFNGDHLPDLAAVEFNQQILSIALGTAIGAE